MPIKVVLPTAFTRHTEGRKQCDSNAANLPALISEFDQTFPALSTQIKDEHGKMRKFINIYVNDEDIRSSAETRTRFRMEMKSCSFRRSLVAVANRPNNNLLQALSNYFHAKQRPGFTFSLIGGNPRALGAKP